MSETDREIFDLIWESPDPELAAQYMINLCVDYLRTHDPFQEAISSAPLESA